MTQPQLPLNALKFSLQLALLMSENEPMQKFHVWSLVTIVGEPTALEMYQKATEVYNTDKSHTLGGWWFRQVDNRQNGLSQRIRRNVRQIMNLEPHSVPDCFR